MLNFVEILKNSSVPLIQISEKTGIDVARLKNYISESEQPTLSEIRKIGKILKVSSDFLLSESAPDSNIAVLFRDVFNNANNKSKADELFFLTSKIFPLLDNFEPFKNIFPRLENTFINARLLASRFRQIYFHSDFYGPLLDLPSIVNNDFKCILLIVELGHGVDGASAVINEVPFIFIAPRFKPRMLFTLAHELAHILSHHDKQENFIKIDKELDQAKRNKFKDEGFANAFASELLMPEEGVGSTLRAIRDRLQISGNLGDVEIIYLSRLYGVSFDVAAKRCEDLHLLPRGGALSLSQNIKQFHGSAEKRAKELDIPERPDIYFAKVSPILLESAISKIEAGSLSIGQVSEILAIPISDILNYNHTRK